jgi:ADP-ribose pyrophosphatase
MHPTYYTRRSEVVYKSDWMTVYEDSVIKDNDDTAGSVGTFNRINVSDAVIVVPVYENRSLLMVENYRHGVGTSLLELPGGFINKDETVLDAARRELLEETGYNCNRLKMKNWFYTWPGRTGQKDFVVVAKGLRKSIKKNLDEFESIKVCKLSEKTIRRELKHGRIKSAVTISALFEGYF